MDILDKAFEEHMRLLRLLEEKDREIRTLRDESGIAREAIRMFCSPERCGHAEEWLRSKGL